MCHEQTSCSVHFAATPSVWKTFSEDRVSVMVYVSISDMLHLLEPGLLKPGRTRRVAAAAQVQNLPTKLAAAVMLCLPSSEQTLMGCRVRLTN